MVSHWPGPPASIIGSAYENGANGRTMIVVQAMATNALTAEALRYHTYQRRPITP